MKPRVLIVDDSLTVRMDLEEAFTVAGFEPVLCGDLASARRALEQGPFALAVLDVLLPDGDGLELLRELKGNPATGNVPVLLLSTEAEVRDRIRGLATGADDYVGKPYDRSYVIDRAGELVRLPASLPGPRPSPHVLIIDDSLTFRELLGAALRSRGYAVCTAETGEEGLRLAIQLRPDALVVDGMLPGIDGATVVRRLRSDTILRRTPCLLLTASGQALDELSSLEAGADSYVRKDEGTEVILARLEAVLRSAATPPVWEAAKSLFGPKRILAVDDSLTYLQELTASLQQEEYDVIQARSGQEALALLAVQPVDCILLDLVMPGLPGEDICRHIKSVPVWRDIPLVMMTAREDREAMLGGLNAGADDFVPKSSEFAVLKARVRAQLRRKQYEDENRTIREELLRKELEAAEAQAQRQLAERLRELTEQLQLIIDTAYDAFVGMDANGLIVKWNKQAETTFGWRAEEVLGQPLANTIIPPAQRPAHWEGLKRFLATGEGPLLNRRIEVMALHRAGHEFPVELTITPVRIGGGFLFSAFAHDITERKAFEQAIKEKNKELWQAIQAKDRFLATMSHELRTPLNAILGFTGTLLMKLPGPLTADQEKQLQTIRTSARHLLSLINDILDLAKIESGRVELHLEPVGCQAVIEEMAAALRPAAEQKGLRFTLDLPAEDVVLHSDRRALSQVLINLVNNAVKFTDQGGVTVRLDRQAGDGQSLVRIAVADTGIGLSADDQRKLFQGFVQLESAGRKRHEGTGLGLYLSRQLARLLGGDLTVESERDRGSTFTLTLPEA